MWERRRRRKNSKEIKETLTSKQNANVNPMGSLVFYTQHKGICYCNDKRDNLKTILSYLETHFSAIHPPSSEMTVCATGNMYLTQQHSSLKVYT
jgi:transcriptional/translational regulatory protein YebC/TACO1